MTKETEKELRELGDKLGGMVRDKEGIVQRTVKFLGTMSEINGIEELMAAAAGFDVLTKEMNVQDTSRLAVSVQRILLGHGIHHAEQLILLLEMRFENPEDSIQGEERDAMNAMIDGLHENLKSMNARFNDLALKRGA